MAHSSGQRHDAHVVDGFRHRGHHATSRIESFSDAVFGFSITLLVVSLQVPRTFGELETALAGFPSFASTFALLAQIWYIQFRFFRRYGLQDGRTIALNIVLLFVIVFFTYPLKFLFGLAFANDLATAAIRSDQIVTMYATYGAGYAAVFAIFLLLYLHAWSEREALELTPIERFDTLESIRIAAFQLVVAAVSVAVAAFFASRGDFLTALRGGGIAYLLTPIGLIGNRLILRRRRPPVDA